MVQRYQPEPILISHIVRIAMGQTAIATTWEFLQSDRWTDAQLAGLQSDWQSVEFFDAAEAAFAMERAMDVETFRLLRKSYDEGVKLGFMGAPSTPSRGLFDDPAEYVKGVYSRWRYKIWKQTWSYEEELFYLQKCMAGLKAIRRTELTGTFVPALKALDAEIARINTIHTNAAGHFLLQGFWADEEWVGKSLLKFADVEAARRLLVSAIALKRYQLRNGKYPAELNGLVPEFLPRTPLDFMDGKPLRYKMLPDGGFLLYSVGEDGEDNGGDPTPTEPEGSKPRSWLKGRDMVWPRLATADEISEYFKVMAGKSAPVAMSAKGRPIPTNVPVGTNVTGR